MTPLPQNLKSSSLPAKTCCLPYMVSLNECQTSSHLTLPDADRAHLVVIFRVGDNVIESKVKTANDIYVCNPLWDEEFVMEVSDPSTDMLRVTVKDTSSDRILGKTKIVLSDLYEYVPSEKWYTLKEAVNIERPGEISLCRCPEIYK